MFRKTSGSVVCPSCGSLVGVKDDKCYMCGRANPALWGFAPWLRQLGNDFGFVPLVIGVCGAMYLLAVLISGRFMSGDSGGLGFLAPNSGVLAFLGASGAAPVFGEHRWWTLLVASWLHGSLPHILFNMMAVRTLAPATIALIGPGRTITIYVLSGVAGFLLTSAVRAYFPYVPMLHGAYTTVGASASICGLLGAISHYGRKSGSSFIRAQTSQWAVGLVITGLVLPGVDNVAHLGGFLGGYGLSAFFNPLTSERGDHMLVAMACLAATALAIAYALWTALPLLLSV